jgi:integrase
MTRTSAPPSYLKVRTGVYYASMEIPKALWQAIGRRRFMISLGTTDRAKAELLKAPYISQWTALIAAARPNSTTPLIQRMTALYQHELAEAKAYVPNPGDPPMPDPVAHLNEELADILADNYPADIANETFGVVTGKFISVREPMDRLIATRTTNVRTADTKRSIINGFLDHWGIDYVHQWTRQAVRGYLQHVVDSGRTGGTAKTHKAHIAAYYSDLRRLHDLELPDPFVDVKPLAPPKGDDTEPFAIEDIPRFLAATANSDQLLHDMILLGAYTGCRYAELANLTKDRLKADHMVVIEAKTKAGNRIVPLHPKISDLIHRFAAESTSTYVIDGLILKDKGRRGAEVGQRFGRLKKSMGFKPRVHSFHSIRKTVMTILEQSGANPIAVNRLLGWTVGGEGYKTYSGGASMKQLKDTVNLIDYSEL